ncbi:MAG TPA: ATP-dependent DNA helicase [Intrasporangium sp.]|uniref:ATP-dependent helicase n=1 Tax=Intrasporangium sp. TaxID=1925024 RepID=UPI002D792F27|nr:ATP-dependent DNA helicase [Intrasporangium sp.]HET7399605.1 ATP-dependent DNA helicase [Intrasporangium sp.]
MVILRRAPARVGAPVELTAAQRAAVDADGPLLRVLGGPGTGKSTLAVELVAEAVRRGARADACLLLASTRAEAARQRERVTARLAATSTQPLARTWQAFGFGVLRAEAALAGEPLPRLVGGPEQDLILRDLLAGHAAGDAPGPEWPEPVRAALGTRGFRNELRDLLMRAVEHGQGPDELAALGLGHGRPEWVAAAHVLREYDAVTAFSRHGSYDPAWVLTATADRLEDDPAALDRLRDRLRLVVVDDAQELTSAAARLLRVVAAAGLRVVLLGDPDSAVQTFRGADPGFLAHGWSALGPGPTVVLDSSHRLPSRIADVGHRVARHIGALGGGAQRGATAVREGGVVDVGLFRSAAQEAGAIGSLLRRAALVDGVPWDDMAVIVRGSGRATTLRRLLVNAGVPVASATTETPVRDEPAVRPLVALFEEALVIARAEFTGRRHLIDPVRAADLLVSPVGGADAVSLRRLRRLLRREELESGGHRSSDELLAELLRQPQRARLLGSCGRAAARVATALEAGVQAAGLTENGTWCAGVTAEVVLWAIWDAAGVAEPWRRTALAGGPGAERADRDLDAVLGLFDAAAAFVDRLPQAGPDQFLDHVTGQDVPGDTLLARSQSGPRVELLTPQSAAGRQWRVVVVAGVQEGVWPDLRLRGSVLGSEELVDVVTGRPRSLRAAQAAVRYDETRLFHVAVTRSTERLVVTAVGNEDEQPSVYLDLVDPPSDADGGVAEEVRPHTEVGSPMTLPGLVGRLRREAVSPDPTVSRAAVELLAVAARAGVAGADPASWWALRQLSDERPVRPDGESVTVSPSKVERFSQCSLSWFLTAVGGGGPSLGPASIGTMVHDVVAEHPDADLETLTAEVDRRWGQLGLPPGWVTERKRAEAHDMVARFVDYRCQARADGWELAAVEVDFEAPVGRARLAGRVDRIERDAAGRLRVVDLKTGAGKPAAADIGEHGQLGAYQVAVESGAFPDLGTGSAGAALAQIGRGAGLTGRRAAVQEQPALKGSDDPDWARRLVEATADGMGAATFRAASGSWCATCAVKGCCPLQREGDAL